MSRSVLATLARAGCLLALVTGLVGCAEELTPQSLVSDMRLLAIRAEPPAVAPADVVHLDALVVDPFEDRSIAYAWATCLNPPADNPARCLQGGTPTLVGQDDEIDVTIPDDALAGRTSGILGVLLYVCAGGALEIGDDGVRCEGEGAEIVGVKRVPIGASENTNPEIESVLIDGVPWAEDDMPAFDVCPSGACDPLVITVQAADDAVESYEIDDERRDEDLVASFAATSGTLDVPFGFGPTTEVEWIPPSGTGRVLFWLALRDNRGGVTWVVRQALVQ